MSFGQQSSERFERPVAASSGPGPGTYDLRASLDEGSSAFAAGNSVMSQRWAVSREDSAVPTSPGMEDERGSDCSSTCTGSYPAGAAAPAAHAAPPAATTTAGAVTDRATERSGGGGVGGGGAAAVGGAGGGAGGVAGGGVCGVSRQRGPAGPSEKENRVPLTHRTSLAGKKIGVRPQSPLSGSTGGEVALLPTASEDREKFQIRKLLAQLGEVAEELKQKKRESKDLQQLVVAKDRKLEEFQRKIEDLAADRREAHRRTSEAEAERDAKRRALHEREQDLASLQRKNEHMLRTIEDRGKRLERTQDEHGKIVSEASTLQDRFATAERERKALDQTVRQQQRRMREAEEGYKSHLAALEDSLRRESERRLELEGRVARAGAEAQHGGTELAAERQRADDLQRRLTAVEAQHHSQRMAVMEKSEQHHQLEVELVTVRAQSAAQADALTRAQEQLREVRERASRAEVASEASTRQLSSETLRIAELEEQLRRFGEEKVKGLEERLEFAESRAKQIDQELKEERERADELERRAAQLLRAGDMHTTANEDVWRRAEQTHQDFEMRALKAEARAEAAAEDLQRWKEWGDEQSLREITAETQRLEELKRVREDLTRQVDEARREVVEENKLLQRQLRQMQNESELTAVRTRVAEQEVRLERQAEDLTAQESRRSELEAMQVDLEAQLRSAKREAEALRGDLEATRDALRHTERQAEEERRALDARARRAEAEAGEAADELAEEREKQEARVKALRIECDAALEARGKEFATTHSAEREAATLRTASLEKALDRERGRLRACRWQALVEGALGQRLQAGLEAQWTEVRRAARTWRILARGHEHDEDRLRRQDDELERLDQELEELREQNRQLLASFQLGQCELQACVAELRRLQEREAAWERDALRISEQNAELGGHANPKQKIKHLMSLKTQIETLRHDLRRCKQQNVQLEAQLRSAQFFDAGAGGAGAAAGGGCGGGGGISGGYSVGELSVSSTRPPRSPSSRRPAAPSQPTTPGRMKASSQPSQQAPRTPSRSSPTRERERTRADILAAAACADDRPEAARRERLEAIRHAKAHRRASERAVTEYQHLAVLVEQVLAHEPTRIAGAQQGSATAVLTTPPPAGGGIATTPEWSQGPGGGDAAANSKAPCEALLQRLRDLSANLISGVPRAAAAAAAAGAAKGACDDGFPGSREGALGCSAPPHLEDVDEAKDGAAPWIAEPEDEASLMGSDPSD